MRRAVRCINQIEGVSVVITLLFPVAVTLIVPFAFGQSARRDEYSVSKERAIASLAASLPHNGAVEAVYTATEGFGEVLIGFDVPSGAWYFITGAIAQGRDAAGNGFAGPPGRYTLKPEDQSMPGADHPLDTFLPTALARDLVARPQTIQEVRPLPDGGYRIVTVYPGGLRDGRVPSPDRAGPRNWWVDVDASGVISAIAYNDEMELRDDARRFHYKDAGLPGFQLVEMPPGYPFRLASYKYSEIGDPSAFAMDRVASLAAQSVVTVAGRVSAAGQDMQDRSDGIVGGGVGGAGPGDAYNPLSRYQLPLLGAGVIVVVIGGFAIWRAKRQP